MTIASYKLVQGSQTTEYLIFVADNIRGEKICSCGEIHRLIAKFVYFRWKRHAFLWRMVTIWSNIFHAETNLTEHFLCGVKWTNKFYFTL